MNIAFGISLKPIKLSRLWILASRFLYPMKWFLLVFMDFVIRVLNLASHLLFLVRNLCEGKTYHAWPLTNIKIVVMAVRGSESSASENKWRIISRGSYTEWPTSPPSIAACFFPWFQLWDSHTYVIIFRVTVQDRRRKAGYVFYFLEKPVKTY